MKEFFLRNFKNRAREKSTKYIVHNIPSLFHDLDSKDLFHVDALELNMFFLVQKKSLTLKSKIFVC